MNQQAASDRLDADVFYRQNDIAMMRDNDMRERLAAEMMGARQDPEEDNAAHFEDMLA